MLPGVVVRVVSSDVGCVLGVCWVYRMASVVSAVAQARKFTYKTGLACAVAYGGGENMRDQLRCVSPPSRARALSLSLSLSLSVGLYRCGDERRELASTATHSRIYICIYMYIYIVYMYTFMYTHKDVCMHCTHSLSTRREIPMIAGFWNATCHGITSPMHGCQSVLWHICSSCQHLCVCVCMCVWMSECMYVPASYPRGRMHQPPRAPTVTINVLWWNVLSYGIECVL